MRIWSTALAPDELVIELGPPSTQTPLHFLKYAARALRRGLAESELQAGASAAVTLFILALESAQALGNWGDAINDVRSAIEDLRQTSLGISKIARGRAAEMIRDIIWAVDATLPKLVDDHAS
jgi:hypothetical protein